MPNDLKLAGLRLSFPVLGEPEFYQGKAQRPGDERRWSATFLVPVNDPQFAKIKVTMHEVAVAKWDKKAEALFAALWDDTKLSCFVDGKRKAYDGYAGHWALTAHRKESAQRPAVVDTDKSPIYMPDNTLYAGKAGRVYGGCYVNAHVNFWAQDNTNGKAVRCELVAIQRFKDGDAFSGGMAPDVDQFDEITEGADADDIS